jgi:hypothetical protein
MGHLVEQIEPQPHPRYGAETVMSVVGIREGVYGRWKLLFGRPSQLGRWLSWDARDVTTFAVMKHLTAAGYRPEQAYGLAVEALEQWGRPKLPRLVTPPRVEAPHLSITVDVEAVRRDVVRALREHEPVDMTTPKRVAT